MKKLIIISCFMLGITPLLMAQEYNKPALDSLTSRQSSSNSKAVKFLLTGYTQTTVMYVPDKEFTISALSFNPIFLWKPTAKIFFEGELEVELEGEETAIGLEYANINYILNRYMNFRVGKFLTPFGIYFDRLHPAWINRLPTAPLGYGHDGVGSSSELGINVFGGIPIGPSKFNYSFYAINGPQLNTGEEEPGEEGALMYGNTEDNNLNKAIGGRIGYLPLSNSSLEIGGSFMNAKVGTKDTGLENVRANLLSVDLTYVKQLSFLKGFIDIKGQWNSVKVDDATYTDWEDDLTGNTPYTYKNERSTLWGQLAYRPTLSKSKFVKNLELVYRYSFIDQPEGAKENEDIKQYTYGLNYWINFRSAMKFAVQSQEDETAYFVQWALLF